MTALTRRQRFPRLLITFAICLLPLTVWASYSFLGEPCGGFVQKECAPGLVCLPQPDSAEGQCDYQSTFVEDLCETTNGTYYDCPADPTCPACTVCGPPICDCPDGTVWQDDRGCQIVDVEAENIERLCKNTGGYFNACGSACPDASETEACVALCVPECRCQAHLEWQDNIGCMAAAFTDTADHWAEEPIETLRETGLTQGYAGGTFQPDVSIVRAEYLKLVLIAAGYPINQDPAASPFLDVEKDAWFAPFVLTAYEEQLILGYPDQTFRPSQTITRAEAVVLLLKAFAIEFNPNSEYSSFHDVTDTWQKGAIEEAYRREIINGYGENLFGPNDPLTRAQAAKIIVLTESLQ